jgi:hypothetical protein
MFKDIRINKGPNVTISVVSTVAIFFCWINTTIFYISITRRVCCQHCPKRMKIREELSGVSSNDQNTMSASAAQDDPSNGNCTRGACNIGPPGPQGPAGPQGPKESKALQGHRVRKAIPAYKALQEIR